MTKRRFILSCLAIALSIIFPLNSIVYGSEQPVKITASQVYDALYNGKNSAILDKVTMNPSLNIAIPKIDMTKVHSTNPIISEDIKSQLKEHGYSDKEINQMTFGDYQSISQTWTLSKETIDIAKQLYPELQKEDLTHWTMGKLIEYSKAKDLENNVYGLTPELIEKFKERNITLDDARTLLKDYHSYENILAQSDEDLKKTLEFYYQFTLKQLKAQASDIRTAAIYEYVYFPGYGYDYFHVNSGSTNSSVAYAQSLRVQAIYNKLYQNTGAFICTNLYGTLSASQGGAHEGIDFAAPGTPRIYAVLSGTVLTPLSSHSSHQLCIKPSQYSSYSYLHMSYKAKSPGQYVADAEYVGNQGNLGNAYGYHVHFEVQDGTNKLAPGNDDVLESYSPYIFF